MLGRVPPFPSIHSLLFDSGRFSLLRADSGTRTREPRGDSGAHPPLLTLLGHRETAGQNKGEGDYFLSLFQPNWPLKGPQALLLSSGKL